MTEDKQDLPSTLTEPTRRLPQISRPQLIGVAAGVIAGILLAGGVVVAAPLVSGPSCPAETRNALRVVATPELADLVQQVADDLASTSAGPCPPPIAVTAQDSAITAGDLANERGDRPDVWIPDSSVWTRRATTPGTGVPADNPAVASSPVVLALAPRTATKIAPTAPLPLSALIPPDADTDPVVRWVLPEPEESALTVGALLELQQAVAGSDQAAARYGAVVRTSTHKTPAPAELATAGDLARPMTEQQLFSFNAEHPDHRLVGAYAKSGFRFDYPFVVLTGERARRHQAVQVLDALRSGRGAELLAAAGFRDTHGTAGPAVTAALGSAIAGFGVAPVAEGPAVNAAIRGYTNVLRPSQLLAVIDVSGSMGTLVPGAGGATRLDLALRAATTGLSVYSDDTKVGVWAFSTAMNGKLDYKVMAPLQELGRGPDGTMGRAHVAQALYRIRVTKGHTGLNDTVLAAVRAVREAWDPKRVNSVVLITDGGNADRDGISTPRLLQILRTESDPDRPVAVFAIAYGPSSDLASLTKISQVTGGRAYAAPDPREIGDVLADAIGRRSCAPSC